MKQTPLQDGLQGVLLESWEPGTYLGQQTGHIIRIPRMPRGFHCQLDAVETAPDTWTVEGHLKWEGASTATELSLLQGFHAQLGGYLAKAVELAATQGVTPAPAPGEGTPAPAFGA